MCLRAARPHITFGRSLVEIHSTPFLMAMLAVILIDRVLMHDHGERLKTGTMRSSSPFASPFLNT